MSEEAHEPDAADPWGGHPPQTLMNNLLLQATSGEAAPTYILLPRNLPAAIERLNWLATDGVEPPGERFNLFLFQAVPDPESEDAGAMVLQPQRVAQGDSLGAVADALEPYCIPNGQAFAMIQKMLTDLMLGSQLEMVAFVAAAASPPHQELPEIHGSLIQNAYRTPHMTTDEPTLRKWRQYEGLIAEAVCNGLEATRHNVHKSYKVAEATQRQIVVPGDPRYRQPPKKHGGSRRRR